MCFHTLDGRFFDCVEEASCTLQRVGMVEEFVFVRPFERDCAVARLDNSNLLPETSCRETSVELAL